MIPGSVCWTTALCSIEQLGEKAAAGARSGSRVVLASSSRERRGPAKHHTLCHCAERRGIIHTVTVHADVYSGGHQPPKRKVIHFRANKCTSDRLGILQSESMWIFINLAHHCASCRVGFGQNPLDIVNAVTVPF